ncbi:MAG: hypothetical protein K0Q94_4771 [Paenibacillus sp.]|jgi:hypothetical protein|nr:hypothetical protein [Paenibacillus sp.]
MTDRQYAEYGNNRHSEDPLPWYALIRAPVKRRSATLPIYGFGRLRNARINSIRFNVRL